MTQRATYGKINIITGKNTYVSHIQEMAIGIVNGVNTVFASTYIFEPDSLYVFKNGLKQKRSEFMIISEKQIELLNPPSMNGFTDEIEITYFRK